MNLHQVVEINGHNVFTLAKARLLLPVILRITKIYSDKVDALIARVDGLNAHNPSGKVDLIPVYEAQINTLILEWQGKIERLGALPKGLWIADFDSGDGYFCWKFPEPTVQYWHEYSDGFSKRIPVLEREQALQGLERPAEL